MFHDEDGAARQPDAAITPGEDLSVLSLEDLAERRAILEAEIRRTDQATEQKKAGRNAADAVFRL